MPLRPLAPGFPRCLLTREFIEATSSRTATENRIVSKRNLVFAGRGGIDERNLGLGCDRAGGRRLVVRIHLRVELVGGRLRPLPGLVGLAVVVVHPV